MSHDAYIILSYFISAAMNEQNITVGPNHCLSDMDKAYITLNYPPISGTNKMGWDLEHALNIIGVSDAQKKDFISGFQCGGWERLRQEILEAVHTTAGLGTQLAPQEGQMEVARMLTTEHSMDVMAHSEGDELASQEGQVDVAHMHTEHSVDATAQDEEGEPLLLQEGKVNRPLWGCCGCTCTCTVQ